MRIIMRLLQLCLGLDDFMAVLDSCLAKSKQLQLATGMVAKKVRKEGAPSDSLPPPDAPSWAVKESASMCHAVTCTLHCINLWHYISLGEANKENIEEQA